MWCIQKSCIYTQITFLYLWFNEKQSVYFHIFTFAYNIQHSQTVQCIVSCILYVWWPHGTLGWKFIESLFIWRYKKAVHFLTVVTLLYIASLDIILTLSRCFLVTSFLLCYSSTIVTTEVVACCCHTQSGFSILVSIMFATQHIIK